MCLGVMFDSQKGVTVINHCVESNMKEFGENFSGEPLRRALHLF